MGTIITPREHEIMDIIELGKLYRPSPCPPTIAIMVDRTLCLGTGEDPNLYNARPTEEQVFKELRRRATSSWAELCERSLRLTTYNPNLLAVCRRCSNNQ